MSMMLQQQLSEPEAWVDRHSDSLFKYAMPRLCDPAIAEEMVQETLLAALQSQNRFAACSSERTWLVGILKYKIIDHFRKVGRERPANGLEAMSDEKLFGESGYWIHETGPADWGTDPIKDFERMRFWKTLEHCLSELPARTASAFSLREMEELSSQQICEVLGVSTSNLRVMPHRARTHQTRPDGKKSLMPVQGFRFSDDE